MKAMYGTRQQKIGAVYALAAFGFWGCVAIYFKSVQHVTSMEILLHRVIWSVPVTALMISMGRDWTSLFSALSSKKVIVTLFLTALLMSSNWFVFIYAVNTDRLLQASLGYYINPLINVLLGIIFLRERLRFLQVVAVLLAAAGTINLVISYGEFPWVALFLAMTFGLYGLLRKTVQIESVNGLFVETSLIFPLASAYLLFMHHSGYSAFANENWQTTVLLVLAGVVTVLPLVWFTSAVRRLRYTTIGIFQYTAPSLMFVLAVFLYNEPFTLTNMITFSFIWAGLAMFVVDTLYLQQKGYG